MSFGIVVKASLSDGDALDLVNHLIDPKGYQSERIAQEEISLRNVAYYAGKQYFYQNGMELREPRGGPDHRVYYRNNRIWPAVQRNVATVMSLEGGFAVAPESGSSRHRNIAKVSNEVLDHMRNAIGYNRIKAIAMTWACIVGSSFYKTVFDPKAGQMDRFYLREQGGKERIPPAVLDPGEIQEKEQQGLFQDVAQGDVRTDVVSIFSFFFDWAARDADIEGMAWAGDVNYWDVSKIAEKFDVSEADIEPEDHRFGPIGYEEAIAFMTSGNSGYRTGTHTPKQKMRARARVSDIWFRPSRKWPRGKRVVATANRVLLNTDNPHIGDNTGVTHLPYTHQRWSIFPGRFWGLSLVEQLTSPQHHLNKAASTMIEIQNVYGHPALLVPEDSGIPEGNFVIEPGAIHHYNPLAGEIKPLPPPQLPAEVAQNRVACLNDLEQIANNAPPDFTRMPAQIRSGEGIRLMNEIQKKPLEMTQRLSLEADQRLGRQLLALGKLFYTEARTLKHMGEDGQFAVSWFTGADLSNDLRVVSQPSISDSATAKRAEILDFVKAGLFDPVNNPDHRRQVLKALEFGTADEAVATTLQDELDEERIIQTIVADPTKYIPQEGQTESGYPVMPFEDHEVRMKVLVRYMLTDEFRKQDAVSQSVIYQLWEKRNALHQEAIRQQVALMEASRGTPVPKGTPSQPRS